MPSAPAFDSYRVILLGADGDQVSFRCGAGKPIYQQALLAGIEMAAGCTQGRCASCRSELVSGSVKSTLTSSPYAASDPANYRDGLVLPCSVTPLADVVLKPRGPWHRAHTRSIMG